MEQWHLISLLPTSAGKFLLQLNSAGALEPDTRTALCTDTSRCSELRVIVTVLPWYPGGSTCDLEVRGHRSGGQLQRKEVLFSGWNVTVFEWQSRNVNMFIFELQGITHCSFQKDEIKFGHLLNFKNKSQALRFKSTTSYCNFFKILVTVTHFNKLTPLTGCPVNRVVPIFTFLSLTFAFVCLIWTIVSIESRGSEQIKYL